MHSTQHILLLASSKKKEFIIKLDIIFSLTFAMLDLLRINTYKIGLSILISQ